MQADAEGLRAFAERVGELRAVLDQARDVPVETKAEDSDVVDLALAETRKPRPNMVKLRGAAFGLATAVQTLGAVPTAYQLVKAAAAAIGVQLP